MATKKLSQIDASPAVFGASDTLVGVNAGATDYQYSDTDIASFVGSCTATFTNKTFNTAGTGNTFQIAGTSITAVTGTGSVVLATSPSLTTPNIGVATATSVNKVAITAPATSATITIADGKTGTFSNTITIAGTDGSTLNVGTGGTLGTAAYKNTGTSGNTVPLLDGANTWSATQTFATVQGTGPIQIGGSSGIVELRSNSAGVGSNIIGMYHAANLGSTFTGLGIASSGVVAWASGGAFQTATQDLTLRRSAAATLAFGAADAASPVAQTLTVQGVVAGTSNTAAANWTFAGGKSTGSGAAGRFVWQGSLSSASATDQNTLVRTMDLWNSGASGILRVFKSYTDSSNGAWAELDTTTASDTVIVGTNGNGTGAATLTGLQLNAIGAPVAKFFANTSGNGAYDIVMGVGAQYTPAINNGNNILFGRNTFSSAPTNSVYNVIIGSQAGQSISGANRNHNTIIGGQAGLTASAANNTLIGYGAGYRAAGSNNTHIGYRAGGYAGSPNTSHIGNTTLGYLAGTELTSGANNTLLGFQAGDNITTGSRNIVIGYDLNAASATGDDQLNIGGLITGSLTSGLGPLRFQGYTYANLPGSPSAGTVAYVTDSSTSTWGATISGGGANPVLAWYNGGSWTVVAG